ncbi:MAG TPA: DUF885 family protein, partial [Blastocatellia bacterium]|nr:DUF885 family protein [Blastocatellia bacterium]
MQQTEDKSAIAASGFPKLVDEYMEDLYARHPNVAAASGIHAWDGRLEDYSGSAIADEVSAIKKFQSRLEKIPPLQLGLSEIFDYQILASNMNSRLLELEQIRSHERNPQIYNEVISTGLLQVATFEYAPADSRIRHIISKEKEIPRLLDAARSNVSNAPAVYLKVALEGFKGTLGFIQDDLPKAFAVVKDARLQADFKKSTRVAAAAVAKYVKYLEQMKPGPSATFAIGKPNYEAKLKYDEGIEIPVDVLLGIANRELAKTQEEFRKTASLMDPRRNAMAVWAEVQADHPKSGTLVEEARKQLDQLVRFIDEKKIVTLPPGPGPTVAPTPDFMRWATASMWTPGPLESRPLPAR